MARLGLIVVDPGHFHAALALKETYANVDPVVHVYAPMGDDLVDFLDRLGQYKTHAQAKDYWDLKIHDGSDFLERLTRERPGDAAIFAGRNNTKLDAIGRAVGAGLHVLADKPTIIRRDQLPALQDVLDGAAARGLVVQDMMGGQRDVTRALIRLIHRDPEIFGEQIPGSPSEPGVEMTSVHHLMKLVSGAPNRRPPWYFDIEQQGDALADIGTHLVDRVHTTLFAGETLDYRRDIAIGAVRRWPTMVSSADFAMITFGRWPAYLESALSGNSLAYQCNTHLDYAVRGIHVGLDMVWEMVEPRGGGDTHTEIWRGTSARIELRHGPEEGWKAQLYVVPLAKIDGVLERRITALAETYPGLGLERGDGEWKIVIPDALRISHDAQFHELTKSFLARVERKAALSAAEQANLLAKYYVTTAAEAASA